jgi:hypothetical protein
MIVKGRVYHELNGYRSLKDINECRTKVTNELPVNGMSTIEIEGTVACKGATGQPITTYFDHHGR